MSSSDDYAALRDGQIVSGDRARPRCGRRCRSATAEARAASLVGVAVPDPEHRPIAWAAAWAGSSWPRSPPCCSGALIAARLSRRLTKPLTDATAATARIADGDLSRAGARAPRRLDRRARRPGPVHQRDGRLARAVARPRAAVPAVGVARPAHAADLDPRLRRGHRRRRRPRRPAGGGASSWPSRGGSNGWCATCSTWPSSRAGSSPCTSSPVDLGELMRRLGRRLPPRGRGRRAAPRRSHRPERPVLGASADRDRLAQVVANLIENALKYADPASSVTVVRRSGGAARSRSPTTGRASPPRTSPTCSSASTWPATSPSARRSAPGSGWPSPASSTEAMGGTVAGRGATRRRDPARGASPCRAVRAASAPTPAVPVAADRFLRRHLSAPPPAPAPPYRRPV